VLSITYDDEKTALETIVDNIEAGGFVVPDQAALKTP